MLENNVIETIYLADISKLEFSSAIWKKVRTEELDIETCKEIVGLFVEDYKNYSFVPFNLGVLQTAENLITKYGQKGLRTLDSIQLASMLVVKNDLNWVLTANKLLEEICLLEGLTVK